MLTTTTNIDLTGVTEADIYHYNLENCCTYCSYPKGLKQHSLHEEARFGSKIEEEILIVEFIKRIFPDFLAPISDSLREIHSIQKSERFWTILIGPWLIEGLTAIFKRLETLKRLDKKIRPDLVVIERGQVEVFAPLDFYNFMNLWDDPKFDSLVMSFLAVNGNLDWEIIEGTTECSNSFHEAKMQIDNSCGIREPSKRSDFKLFILEKYAKYAEGFCGAQDSFLISTYLHPIQTLITQLFLGQFPQYWRMQKANVTLPNAVLRNRLNALLHSKLPTQYSFLSPLLAACIPTVYLEGFQLLLKQVNSLKWPQHPRLIYTANSYQHDDVFKLWAALKIDQGAKYIIGQHGGRFGTHRNLNAHIETSTPDAFLTWGWRGINCVPAFNFKFPNLRRKSLTSSLHKDDPFVLFIQRPWMVSSRPEDSHSKLRDIFFKQSQLVDSLRSEIKNELVVKLHPEHMINPGNQLSKWRSIYNGARFADSKEDIYKLYIGSKLVIHGYYSTGLIECLSQNIPTVVYLEDGIAVFCNVATATHQRLIDVGIAFENFEEMATHINRNWANLDNWWNSEEVQNTRLWFIREYSNQVMFPGYKLSRILKGQLGRQFNISTGNLSSN